MPDLSASPVLGLHHVTATTSEAIPDHHFYTRVLGMRLVKKTVNFDDPRVYHFYYATQDGPPGTVFTTFPYAGQGIRRGRPGHGHVYATRLTVPEASLGYWEDRLKAYELEVDRTESFGRPGLEVQDPSGLRIGLEAYTSDERPPWVAGGVPAPFGIRGLGRVVLRVPDLEPAARFLVEELGCHRQEERGEQVLLGLNGGGAGKEIVLWQDARADKGKGGMGTVHHVAFQVKDLDDLKRMRRRVADELEIKTTEIKDRKYFQSIYFRFPGGVLFEIATSSPGFSVDEPEGQLGEHLMLPDWAEPDRRDIERQLPELAG